MNNLYYNNALNVKDNFDIELAFFASLRAQDEALFITYSDEIRITSIIKGGCNSYRSLTTFREGNILPIKRGIVVLLVVAGIVVISTNQVILKPQ
jgi:hypothetical protein